VEEGKGQGRRTVVLAAAAAWKGIGGGGDARIGKRRLGFSLRAALLYVCGKNRTAENRWRQIYRPVKSDLPGGEPSGRDIYVYDTPAPSIAEGRTLLNT
jgi:hypothetical protein